MKRFALFIPALGLLFLASSCSGTSTSGTAAPRSYRVALVQFDTVPGENVKNVREMERLARQAAEREPTIIMFHELCVMDYVDDVSKHAEYVPEGPSSQKMEALARELGVYLSFGLAEKTRDGRAYITYVFTGPKGFVHKYRKTWLWRAPEDEAYRNEWARYDTGKGPELFDLAGLRATCFICADGESPRCITRATDLEPQLVFYPNNRGSYLGDRDSFKKRAQNIGAAMLVTNRVGRSWHEIAQGGCSVISASGEVLAKSDPAGKEEIVVFDLVVGEHIPAK